MSVMKDEMDAQIFSHGEYPGRHETVGWQMERGGFGISRMWTITYVLLHNA